MAMLKTISQGHRTADGALRQDVSGHTGSTKDLDDYLYLGPKSGRTAAIEGYLEHGHGMNHRPLAFGKTPELRHEGEHGWSREMDRTRKAWDKDFDRTYYHFTISADPEDHVGPEELRDVGLEWVRRALPGTQAVVSVHADNAGGIMHAHIVVNSVYPDTGRKIHRSNADVEREADICQDICREHGLGTLPYLRDLRRRAREAGRASISEQAERTSVTEREMRARGARSWVGEIRDAVDACVATSRSWAEFEREMAARGLGIRRPRRGGVTYSHPDSTGHTYRIRSERLGLAYTEEGIRARIATSLDSAEGGAGAPARDGAMARKSIRSTRDAARYARRVGIVPKGAGRR
ncbi:MAG: relaxase/mobilization nuclease domain-containing protein, partial [Olsenella sp.]|nr:relaxase/mobilization nuclease domain-containing protein [Olsenella sp.]